MPRRSGKRRKSSQGYWSTRTVLSTLFLEFFGTIFLLTTVALAADGREIWEVAACFLFATLLVLIPVGGYYLRNRAITIAGPRIVVRDGAPAVAFPADHRAIPVSAAAYAIIAAVLLCFSMNAPAFASPQMLVLGLPALFLLSYPLFALTGRLVDDGTYLTEHGVSIRARGIRAELPWSSIAGSHTVAGLPWQFPRIVIELHPGSPRDARVTVPWWIGSPRPRHDSVYLTVVQVPGISPFRPESSPSVWISSYAAHPPTARNIAALSDLAEHPPTEK